MPEAVVDLDVLDRDLVDALQTSFPLVHRPFAAVGERVGLSEQEAMERTRHMRESGLIRQISAIFDTRKLGYASTLVAAQVRPERIEDAAAVVSEHPGVSHNYERRHRYNLWFTMAVPPGGDLEATLARLGAEAGFEKYRILPSLKTYRIGVRFRMSGDAAGGRRHRGHGEAKDLPDLSAFDRAAIRELQEDFPVIEAPFAPMALELDVTEDELFAWANRMTVQGRLRRVAAVLRHRKAGFSANAMVVWDVPEETIDTVGTFCGEIDAISHCYRRPTFDDWPYGLYTMIHGREPGDCEAVIAQVTDRFGDLPHETLYSTREFKKERVRYFVED